MDNKFRKYTVIRIKSDWEINWDSIPKAYIDIYKWTEGTRPSAAAQLVYVEGYGFVCRLSCEENDPYTERTKDGQDVWNDSALEFFISFDGRNYLNVESNSKGVKMVEYGSSRFDRKPIWKDIPDAVTIEAIRTETGWSVIEMLPLTKIQKICPAVTEETFATGKVLRANFYKTGTDDMSKDLHHYGMWNEVGTENPDYHRPEYFGELIFK